MEFSQQIEGEGNESLQILVESLAPRAIMAYISFHNVHSLFTDAFPLSWAQK